MSLTGSQFATSILNMLGAEREQAVVDAVFAGSMPSFLKSGWPEVRAEGTVDGRVRQIRYLVTPDYLAVGSEDDFLYTPEWPRYAQEVGDAFDCILPSSRIVEQIFRAAVVKLPLVVPPIARPVSPKMETTAAWVEASNIIRSQLRNAPGYHAGVLVAGAKKDVVVGPGLNGSKVAIFGGAKDTLSSFWQPYSTIHPSNYSDYSHGIRLVGRQAFLDDQPVDLVDIFQDPKLSVLVSSQGPFRPFYPSMGALPAAVPPRPNFQFAAMAPQSAESFVSIGKLGLWGVFGYLSYKALRRLL